MPREKHAPHVLQRIRRLRDHPPTSRPWWCHLLISWILAGVLVCVESMPDVAGHAHGHTPDHLTTPWHGETAGDMELGGDSQGGSGFHCHVTIDHSSIDSDACPPLDPHPGRAPMADSWRHDEDPPLAPWLAKDRPPLI